MMTHLTGTSLIRWLQQFSPTLDLPFTILTVLGNESFFLLFLPLVYWCFHRRIGAGLAILFLLSASLNAIAKAMFGMPRPFTVDSSVMQLVAASGNGFPSGHTQGAVVVWLYLAARLKNAWLWWIAGLLIFLIPLSRLYLGVHFPLDLAGGYLIGGLLLMAFIKVEDPVAKVVATCSKQAVIIVWCLVTSAAVWMVKAHGPYVVSAVAALMGTGLGLFIERRWIGFEINPGAVRRCLRYLMGIAVLIVIYVGLKIGFERLEPRWLFRFIRYGLVGLWITAGAPLFFRRV